MGIFGKSKDKDSPPTKDGTSVVSIYVTVSTFEGAPTQKINKTIQIGSQVGDLVINDDSISPKHCTIALSNGVLSVIDHNSEAGTYIGKKQIRPNRTFIFNATDKVRIGRHFLEFIEKEETVNFTASDIDPNIPQTEVLSNTTIQELNRDIDDEMERQKTGTSLSEDDIYGDEDTNLSLNRGVTDKSGTLTGLDIDVMLGTDDEVKAPDPTKGKVPQFEPLTEIKELSKKEKKALEKEEKKRQKEAEKLKKQQDKEQKKNRKKNAKAKDSMATGQITLPVEISVGPILRLASFGIDFLLSLSVINVFESFNGISNLLTGLKEAFAFLPKYLYSNYIGEHATALLGQKNEAEIIKVIATFYEDQEYFFEGLYLMFVLRMVSSLLLGNSLGQVMIFLTNSKRHPIQGRILSYLRELLGQLLFPFFFISEFPGLLGKRSLKEVLSTQKLLSRSKWKSSFAMPFILLFSFTLYSLSPLFAELKLMPTIDVLFQASAKKKKSFNQIDHFNYFKFSLNRQIDNYEVIPTFNVSKGNKGETIHPLLNISHRETQDMIQLKVIKNFNIRDLVGIAINPNPLSVHLYPNLFGLVHDAGVKNKNLKGRKAGSYWERVQEELYKVFLVSFHHPIEKVHESVMINGPIFTGTVNFRTAFEKIVDKKIEMITLGFIGKTPVIRIKVDNKVKYEELILTIQETSYLYALKSENASTNFKQFQSFFDQLTFEKPAKAYKKLIAEQEGQEGFGTAQIIDFFADSNLQPWQRSLLNKYLVNYYKDRIAHHLEEENLDTLNLYKESLQNIINKVGIFSGTFVTSELHPTNPYDQLTLELNELLRGLEEGNMEFFEQNGASSLTNDIPPDINKNQP
ncbi:FHA domain-containing protein [Bacteriovoracaceae bacterium]|nr:FHA domain-containing protein [Bacteriovoracaceae bacterium]